MENNPFTNSGGQPIVYVREVAPDDLPDELKGTDARLYALHDAAGNRLAVTPDRSVAFALARRNDLQPLSVH
ncbi:MAG TPA: DUF1150 family protein [Thermohalobaculum sp.]|nr:DUF1150 family protein [Thermohalobaculum sp.]